MKLQIIKTILTILLPTLFTIANGSILEFRNKYLLLMFDDVNYRFTLQREFIPSKEYSKDLLFFNIPPTSSIILKIDNISYNLNEYKIISPPQINKDGVLSFTSDIQGIIATINFRFIKNGYSLEEDSIAIEVELINASNISKEIGVRYLLDTVFGENTPNPKFYLDGKNSIDYELLINQNNMISFIVSSEDINKVNNLYITWDPTPSRIIFSNWRRINIATWDVEPSPFLKYRFSETSSEDCAVAIFFEGISLKPNEKKNFKVILSTTQFSSYIPSTQQITQNQITPEQQESTQIITQTTTQPTLQPEPKIVIITNYIFLTNETPLIKTQEVTLPKEIFITNFITNVETNILPQQTSVIENGETKKKIQEIEEKIEKLTQNMDILLSQITNLKVPKEDKETEKDISELKKIKTTIVKLSKTIDTLEERIAMMNKYIELRKKFSDKRIIVYSPEEYKKDIETIEQISSTLDEILNNILFEDSTKQ